jgi:serine/threonine protein kinase
MEILKKIRKGPPAFPNKIPISKESQDFILKFLTVDPKKRITWKAIYEHPLINDKKKIRDTYVAGLKSTINVDKNKDFYNKEKIPNMPNTKPFEIPKGNDDLV